mmetsp:Transcript_77565/g.225114  ORF Transcript_77565/g.225114 Transcript_77565/m.225114 type:complete len:107 (+) Transcript_77565:861-1181(+)
MTVCLLFGIQVNHCLASSFQETPDNGIADCIFKEALCSTPHGTSPKLSSVATSFLCNLLNQGWRGSKSKFLFCFRSLNDLVHDEHSDIAQILIGKRREDNDFVHAV